MAELVIRPNKQTLDYLKAYGEAFGCDAAWAAMFFIRNGVDWSIQHEMLSKARKEMNLSKGGS